VEFARAARALAPLEAAAWAHTVAQARAEYEAWQGPRPVPGPLDLWTVMAELRRRLPRDAIMTNGAGNFSTWLHRFYRYGGLRTQLGPTSGAMGYGVPAAIAAKLLEPERRVVALTGDGDFLMTGQELATAVQERADIVILLVNNGMYGTIRMHQEREYPGRVHGSALANPDFAALARAYGAHGERVERTEQFAPAFERACAAGRPALIELVVDPQAITPNTTLEALRQQSLARSTR
jgi:acetolactate synthase-1/2/3 large subunit